VTRRRITVLTAFHGANTNNASVNGAAHAVILLVVHLGNLVVLNNAGLADITERRCVNHILDNKPLHCLVLFGLAAAAVAKNGRGHATSVLGASIIAPLLSHAVIEICPESTSTAHNPLPFLTPTDREVNTLRRAAHRRIHLSAYIYLHARGSTVCAGAACCLLRRSWRSARGKCGVDSMCAASGVMTA
jgi:hypothetical protein